MSQHLRQAYESHFDSSEIDVRAHESRFQILENILALTMKHGIESLTLSELSRHSGYSKARILYHYRDLDLAIVDLFELTIRVGQKITIAKIAEAEKTPTADPRQMVIRQIIAIFESGIEWLGAYEECGRFFLLVFSIAGKRPQLRKLHETFLETGRARMESYLLTYLSPKDAKTASLLIHNFLLGVVVRMVSLNHFSKRKSILMEAIAQVERTIDAHAPRH